ncbi:cerebral cavernous malformations protein 2 homolog isoform X2 [Mytilus californianus]|uniref:cerebral cavernous malformations protein 2 homolog isoform X2 n=1 Tax=Mytilus californianus TaxID=6549 RepID=UPI00224605CB|nr:cerebral cavernous malformations protein 2 homolog isoform X2 [Mytilus californianus]
MDRLEFKERKLMSLSRETKQQKVSDPSPDYLMGDLLMKKDYIESDVWYAGLIPGVPVEVDVTNRTDVLRIIDRGKKEELVPLQLSQDPDAVFSLSKSNIRIHKQDYETLDIPIHVIAAVCYIKDDGLHTLAIKYGIPDKCDLAVLYCKNQAQADTICAAVGQCFQRAYQEATIELLQETIRQAEKDRSSIASSEDQEETKPRKHRTRSVGEKSETSSIGHHALLVKEYMNKLPNIFTNYDELKQFGTLFQALNDPLNTDISDICDKMFKLYGPKREHLMTELCPFIPSKHYQYFERFLKDKSLSVSENGHSTMSSSHSYNRIYTRSQSDVSTMNASDLDHVLERLSVELEKMDASVGDVNNSYIYTNNSDT